MLSFKYYNVYNCSSPSLLQMQLAPVRLSELHSDLKIQEKDELQWKKLKAEGMDEDGEREAKLRRNFNSRILFLWDMAFKELMKKLDEQFSFIC